MSYSFNNECFGCNKEKDCTDRVIIANAIDTIHSNTRETGHLGAGSIDLNCQNRAEKTDEATPESEPEAGSEENSEESEKVEESEEDG